LPIIAKDTQESKA
jgi:hypothetical protein